MRREKLFSLGARADDYGGKEWESPRKARLKCPRPRGGSPLERDRSNSAGWMVFTIHCSTETLSRGRGSIGSHYGYGLSSKNSSLCVYGGCGILICLIPILSTYLTPSDDTSARCCACWPHASLVMRQKVHAHTMLAGPCGPALVLPCIQTPSRLDTKLQLPCAGGFLDSSQLVATALGCGHPSVVEAC